MNKEGKLVILLFMILIFIVGILLVLYFTFKNDSEYNLLINNNSVYSDTEVIPTDNYENENIYSFKQDYFEGNFINEESGDENINSEIVNDVFYNEENVVNYFKDIELEVELSTSFKEKFKEYFIMIMDFIFYDDEIRGYFFDELSDSAKANIIAIALKIDNKIEEYIPNYKEDISSTSSKVYNNVKDRLVALYMDISGEICTKNEEECNKVKGIFTEIKDICKIGWNYIKELASNGVSNLKEWYEVYSGK